MDPNAFSKSVATVGGGRVRDARLPLDAVPYAQSGLAADPADLVARALAILAEDNFTNDATRSLPRADIAAELRTPSVGSPA